MMIYIVPTFKCYCDMAMPPDSDGQPHDLQCSATQYVMNAEGLSYPCRSCSETFITNASLTVHQKSCANLKRTLDDALQAYADQAKKKRRANNGASIVDSHSTASQGPSPPLRNDGPPIPQVGQAPGQAQDNGAAEDDLDRSLAQRRVRRENIPLPRRLTDNNAALQPKPRHPRDALPQPHASASVWPDGGGHEGCRVPCMQLLRQDEAEM